MTNSLIREADISDNTDIPAKDFEVDPAGSVAEEDVGDS